MDYDIRVGEMHFSEGERVTVISQINGEPLGTYAFLTENELNTISETLSKNFQFTCTSQAKVRESILRDLSSSLSKHSATFIDLLIRETGKPFLLAKAEIDAAFMSRDSLLNTAADEALRNTSIIEPMFVPVGSIQRMTSIRRYPVGPILSSISELSPLVHAVHELGSSIACGAPLMLRPPHEATLSVMELARIVNDVIGQTAWFTAAPMNDELFCKALNNGTFKMLSFFGGIDEANELQKRSCVTKSAIRSFSGAAAIVDLDCDLKRAADHITRSAFANAGRLWSAVKSVYVHTAAYDTFCEMFFNRTSEIAVKLDPFDKETIYAPLRTDDSVIGFNTCIESCTKHDLKPVVGGTCSGRIASPTIIEVPLNYQFDYKIPPQIPVCLLYRYDTIDNAVEALCNSGLGSTVILFSREQDDGLRVLKNADIGTLIMNEYSYEMEPGVLYRSLFTHGNGSAGIRFAITEFTEQRTLLFNNWWGG